MKKKTILAILILCLIFAFPASAFADEVANDVSGENSSTQHEAGEESEDAEESEETASSEDNSVEYDKETILAGHTCELEQPETGELPVVRWTTSKSSVASISSDGIITAKKTGTATIEGYDENDELRKSIEVTVKLGSDYAMFIAHRGYCVSAPENTLPAFREAVDAGFRGLELDIWESTTTSEESMPCLIVFHDKNLQSKTGVDMKTDELNRDNRSDCKIKQNVNGIEQYGPQEIPTLDEALECIYEEASDQDKSDFIVEIDVKNALSDRAVKHVIELVGDHRVHVMSSKQKTLKKFKEFRKHDTTEVWYCTGTSDSTKRMAKIKEAGSAGFDGISIPYTYMNEETIDLAKSYNMQIGGYEIETAEEVQHWTEMGCTRFNMFNKVFEQ